MAKYILGERDVSKLKELWQWYMRSKNVNLHRRRPRTAGGGAGSVELAVCNEDASSQSDAVAGVDTPYIMCNIYNPDLTEPTCDGETPPATCNVKVYCKIFGGGKLDEAVPRLKTDDEIWVIKKAGVWWCIDTIQASCEQECE